MFGNILDHKMSAHLYIELYFHLFCPLSRFNSLILSKFIHHSWKTNNGGHIGWLLPNIPHNEFYVFPLFCHFSECISKPFFTKYLWAKKNMYTNFDGPNPHS
jgi:hypothetical protein